MAGGCSIGKEANKPWGWAVVEVAEHVDIKAEMKLTVRATALDLAIKFTRGMQGLTWGAFLDYTENMEHYLLYGRDEEAIDE